MASTILIKRSTTTGEIPTAQDIQTGEFAVNTVDRKIFTNNQGTIVELGTLPSSLNVTNNVGVGGTLNVTGATTMTSGSTSGGFTVAGNLTLSTEGTSDTHVVTKAYVDTAVANVVDNAPGLLDTLNELAAAINDDANFAVTVTNSIATKLNKAGDTMTGDLAMGTNAVTSTANPTTDNELARKGYVDTILGSAQEAETSATQAATSETNAANSASSASTSETNAASSATSASSSATSASSSAASASSSATSASNSATSAASSAASASTSAANAENAWDSFDDRYLGVKSSNPTTDNDGQTLLEGALYFNSAVDSMKVWTGNAWQDVVDLSGDVTVNSLTSNGDISLGDNDKATFGASDDLQIYHDGNSWIKDTGSGNLVFDTNGNGMFFKHGDETLFEAYADGAVNLRHNNSNKLATTSTGVDVTGTVTADGLVVENNTTDVKGVIKNTLTGGSRTATLDILPQNDGAYGFTLQASGGSGNGLIKFNNKNTIGVDFNNDVSFYEDTGTTAKMVWDASAESLGIGTASPSFPLHVTTGGTGTTAGSNTAIHLSSGASGRDANIRFGDNVNASARIGYLDTDFYFFTNGAERMRINSAGNVGIGTSSPTAKLQVEGAGGQDTFTLSKPSNGLPSLRFKGASSDTLFEAGNDFRIYTGSTHTERMRLDSSGNLLVGTTDSTLYNNSGAGEGCMISAGGRIDIADTGTCMNLNKLNTDGEILSFRKDGSTVGSIGTTDGQDIYIGSDDTGLRFGKNADAIWGVAAGTTRDGAIDLGWSSGRFKDLYLSGGVNFGGTGGAVTSKTLDDYEEGSWSPVTGAGNISGTSITYYGKYTKIGRLVVLHFRAYSPSSDLKVTTYQLFSGLPFAVDSMTGTGTVVTEDIDQFDRQGFAAVTGTSFAISKSGSTSGTTALEATISYYTA